MRVKVACAYGRIALHAAVTPVMLWMMMDMMPDLAGLSKLTQNLALAKLCWLLGQKQMIAALLPW